MFKFLILHPKLYDVTVALNNEHCLKKKQVLYFLILQKNTDVHAPPVAQSGNALPLAREISFMLFPDIDVQDRIWTLVAMQWGQVMTHDMAMIDGSTQSSELYYITYYQIIFYSF